MENTKTLDIVELVQNNPIIKLKGNYGSKIIERIQQKFNEDEQKLFVANFYCYLNYNTEKDFVIDLESVRSWLGYTRLDNLKLLLTSNFEENTDYKIEKAAPENSGAAFAPEFSGAKAETRGVFAPEFSGAKTETRGGSNKERIFLTIDCFKELCMCAKGKKENKSKEIRKYFIKLEKIMNELVEEQHLELEDHLRIKDEQLLAKDREHEKNLIFNFDNKNVVYIILVRENIVKFGHTQNIKRRMYEHRKDFGKDIVLRLVFETVHDRNLETVIKQDKILKKRIFEEEYGHNQIELIRLDPEFTFSDLELYVENLKKHFNKYLLEELNLENEINKRKYAELELKYGTDDIRKKQLELDEKEYELKKKKLEFEMGIIPRVPIKDQFMYQVYNQDLTLKAYFSTIEELCMSKDLPENLIPQSVAKAAKNNKLYSKLRFFRFQQGDKIEGKEELYELKKTHNIPPTVVVKTSPRNEQIVMLDIKKTQILGVYESSKDAAEKNYNITLKAGEKIEDKEKMTEDEIIKYKKNLKKSISECSSNEGGKLGYGYVWYRFKSAPKELMKEYVKKNEIPKVKINRNQVIVYKFDRYSKLVATYETLTKAIKAERTQDANLKKHIKDKSLLNNHYFSFTDRMEGIST